MAREYTDEELIGRLRELISKFDDAEDEWNRSEWSKKHGDRLGQYSEKLKVLNGDDFDLLGESYDEFHKDYEDIGDDAYIDALEKNIKKVLERVWPEATPEEIESTAEQICDEHKVDEMEGEEAKEEAIVDKEEVPAEPVEAEIEIEAKPADAAEEEPSEEDEDEEEDPIASFNDLVKKEKAKYERK